MRGSGGVRRQVPVSKTVNGRMSEAQAAFALASLEALDENMARNRLLHETYAKHLQNIPGLTLHSATGVSASNFQQAVITVDERLYGMGAQDLLERLHHNGVSARPFDFPVAQTLAAAAVNLPQYNALAKTGMELPLGSATGVEAIGEICEALATFRR
jgi:dTDP-4-amino-4,6-dideoxygalactose transaminase